MHKGRSTRPWPLLSIKEEDLNQSEKQWKNKCQSGEELQRGGGCEGELGEESPGAGKRKEGVRGDVAHETGGMNTEDERG